MDFIKSNIKLVCQENEIYENKLSLDGKHLLELGCGKAYISRMIATKGEDRSLVAMEVDEIQHKKNLQIDDLPHVRFVLSGAQDIPENDNTFDVVFMFKSLHHVPLDLMDKSLEEIHRVLKPGGIAYLSEPVFDGDFNEIIRLFHDEEVVRQAAFASIEKAVKEELFLLDEEIFFCTPRHYDSFDVFEGRFIKVTHTDHQLSADQMTKVRNQFLQHMTEDGADFLVPVRVDVLRKA